MTTKPELDTPLTLGEIESTLKAKSKPVEKPANKPKAAKPAKVKPAKAEPAKAEPAKAPKAAKPAKVVKAAKAPKTPKVAKPKTPEEPRKRKETANLVRIDQNGARFTPGWQVKIRTEKLTTSKWFSDKATGGEAKGKVAAAKWRDAQLASVK